MSKAKLIQVYEHEKLSFKSGKQGYHANFKERHFNSLVLYNEQNDSRFFTIVHCGVKFKHYVGVIQVGNLVIEILPKVDKGNNKDKWRNALLEMLKKCRKIPHEISSEANLHLRNSNLMDIYIRLFLSEIEMIVHQGLVKKYRRVHENQSTLRGALQFTKHIQRNSIHKERFFVNHQVYDKNHLLHQILNEALILIKKISSNFEIVSESQNLSLNFSDSKRIKIQPSIFSQINFNRKTQGYEKAIEIAKMLLLNFSPDIQQGSNNILAILFDMNRLWEEYLFRELKAKLGDGVSFQNRKPFWESRGIRPDIVVKDGDDIYIIDAKWKHLYDANPSDADLKQMYVYHQYWKAKKTFLVYPRVNNLPERIGVYHFPAKDKFQCQILFVDILDDTSGKLNQDIGSILINKIF